MRDAVEVNTLMYRSTQEMVKFPLTVLPFQ